MIPRRRSIENAQLLIVIYAGGPALLAASG